VPPEFKAVQWTRLPGGETNEAFCARVQRLLGGETAPLGGAAASIDGRSRASGTAVKPSRWLPLVSGGVALAAVIAMVVHSVPKPGPSGNTMPAKPAGNVAAATEASRLVARAWELVNKPDEPRALLALGLLRRNVGVLAGARDSFGRLAKNPAFAATAWNELGWAEYLIGEFRAADLAAERSMAVLPYWGNLGLKFLLTLSWLGDLDQAKVLLERTPAAIRQEDFGDLSTGYRLHVHPSFVSFLMFW
jgi:hypothetical protein